jgi:DNA-dependent protein kinase catalytic subunit
MVDVTYRIFCQEKLYSGEVRRTTIERVTLPILRLVHKTALMEFVTDHMSDLRTTLEAKIAKVSSPGRKLKD